MRANTKIMFMVIVLFIVFGEVSSFAEEIYKEFDAKRKIVLETISGDCEIRKGKSDKIEVTVINKVHPSDSFEPIFRDRGDILRLEERFSEESRGSSIWLLTVPDGIEIKFESASGNMNISDLKGEFRGSTASGDYEIYNCKGEFDLNTASGDCQIVNCEGMFDINSASGDLEIRDVVTTYDSEFSSASGSVDGFDITTRDRCNFASASGNVDIVLAKSPGDDLNIGSASGDARLNYNGNEIVGYVELSAKKRGGDIKSDFKFEYEEEYRKNGQTYIKKFASLKGNTPTITVGTATGRAELKK